MTRDRKGDGRRAKGFVPVAPPASGVHVEIVDEHTLVLRSHDLISSEDAAFVGDVLSELHIARQRSILGIPEHPIEGDA